MQPSERGILIYSDPKMELPPESEVCSLYWPPLREDFLFLAHPWRRILPEETKRLADRVVEKHGGVIATPEAFAELLACFDDPRKQEKRTCYIPTRTRKAVLSRGVCAHCGVSEGLQVDHKRPFSAWGSHHISNLQALCASCNASKGDRTMEEWLADQ